MKGIQILVINTVGRHIMPVKRVELYQPHKRWYSTVGRKWPFFSCLAMQLIFWENPTISRSDPFGEVIILPETNVAPILYHIFSSPTTRKELLDVGNPWLGGFAWWGLCIPWSTAAWAFVSCHKKQIVSTLVLEVCGYLGLFCKKKRALGGRFVEKAVGKHGSI